MNLPYTLRDADTSRREFFAASGFRLSEFVTPCALLLAIVVGLAASRPHFLPLISVFAIAPVILLSFFRWRIGTTLLIAYLPFSGVATVLLYPNTAPATLIKDVLFIAPVYAGYFLLGPRALPRAPLELAPFALFAMIVVVQILNPHLPSLLVGAVGAKVWLWYIPLYFVGFSLIRTDTDLRRYLALMSITAIPPAIIGIVQAVLIATGNTELAYRYYGEAARAMTQNFASFSFEGSTGILRRVPSTFPFVTQYYLYINIMLPVAIAWYLGYRQHNKLAERLGPLAIGLLIVANLTSGARSAFLMLPLLLLLIAIPFWRSVPPIYLVASSGAAIAAFFIAGAILEIAPTTLVSHAFSVGRLEFYFVFIEGFARVGSLGLFGFGTGYNTGGVRHITSQLSTTRYGEEGWYIKVFYELGIMGLLIVIWWLTEVWRQLNISRKLVRDTHYYPLAVGILALSTWVMIYSTKGSVLDMDPLNVYFWLFGGMAVRLPSLVAHKTEVD